MVLDFNVYEKDLEECCRLTPCLNQPTVPAASIRGRQSIAGNIQILLPVDARSDTQSALKRPTQYALYETSKSALSKRAVPQLADGACCEH